MAGDCEMVGVLILGIQSLDRADQASCQSLQFVTVGPCGSGQTVQKSGMCLPGSPLGHSWGGLWPPWCDRGGEGGYLWSPHTSHHRSELTSAGWAAPGAGSGQSRNAIISLICPVWPGQPGQQSQTSLKFSVTMPSVCVWYLITAPVTTLSHSHPSHSLSAFSKHSLHSALPELMSFSASGCTALGYLRSLVCLTRIYVNPHSIRGQIWVAPGVSFSLNTQQWAAGPSRAGCGMNSWLEMAGEASVEWHGGPGLSLRGVTIPEHHMRTRCCHKQWPG